jgi:hypothetical protein
MLRHRTALSQARQRAPAGRPGAHAAHVFRAACSMARSSRSGAEMDVQHRWHVGLDGAQEVQEFGASMAAMQVPDDRSGGNVQRRIERGRTMALVVVGAPLGDAGRQRQQGLRAVLR